MLILTFSSQASVESDTGIINLNGPGRSFRNGELLDLSRDWYFKAFPIHSQYSFGTCQIARGSGGINRCATKMPQTRLAN